MKTLQSTRIPVLAACLGLLLASLRAAGAAEVVLTYAHDDLGRLQTVTRSDAGSAAWVYDEAGNITNITVVNPDTDGDGLRDVTELWLGTPVASADGDGDGLSDSTEVCFDGNCLTYNPFDPVTNPGGTDLNVALRDTDGDGWDDRSELAAGTNPLDATDQPVAAPDGDLNEDGVVDVRDVQLGVRILSGAVVATDLQRIKGDVAPLAGGIPSPDGQFNIADVLLIQRKVAGLVSF